MIKKIIILALLIIVISLSFILYKKINKYKLPKQYKIEMEKLIDEQTPKTKKCIDDYFSKAEKEYSKIKNFKDTEYIDESVFLIEDSQRGIEVCEFDMISKLIDKTEQYTNIKDKIPPTDFTGTLNEFLYPYFYKNNVDYQKLINISEYANNKIHEINHYSYKKLSEDDIYKPQN